MLSSRSLLSRRPALLALLLSAPLLPLAWGTARRLAPAQDEHPWPLVEPAPAVALRPAALEEREGVTACAECHAAIVEEWAGTSHAISWVDEVYREAIADRRNPGLCTACHIPAPLLVEAEPARPSARAERQHLGVDCAACHLGPEETWLGPRGTPTDAHATRASAHLTAPGSSALCARCHSTNIGPVLGIAKDFVEGKLEERGLSCVGCHMAPVADPGSEGPPRRSHALQTPRDPTFLRRAFAVRLDRSGGGTALVVENRAGHRVPGLIGRELDFVAEALDEGGKAVARAEHRLDARSHLPLGASFRMELSAPGTTVRLVGDHRDPRDPERSVRFLEETLR